MTQPEHAEAQSSTSRRRRSGAKPYPTLKFEDVVVLAKTISDQGVSERMRRLSLFERLERSPDSGHSRMLVSGSSKYGLTTGSYQAEHLVLTEDGKAIAGQAPNLAGVRQLAFGCAIERFLPFKKLYDKLKNQRIPADDILHDELAQVGIQPEDVSVVGEVFIANARYIGLIRNYQGTDRLVPIEQVLEDDVGAPAPTTLEEASPITSDGGVAATAPAVGEPSVHIDIQIHIDSTAEPEQIDKVFSSMAKHLYGRNV